MSKWQPDASTITERRPGVTRDSAISRRVLANFFADDADPSADLEASGPQATMGWTKASGCRALRRTLARRQRPGPRRHPTGEQRECEPCAIAGRQRLGVTRGPGLVACLRCWQLHERCGQWPTIDRPHDVDACRLCHPSTEPAEPPPLLGSLLPYNPVDRPLSATVSAFPNPWEAVDLARRFAEAHAHSGNAMRPGYDFGPPEIAVAEAYARLTLTFGPIVRPSVREICDRVGFRERRVQYALRALQRAGLLYQHADGCVVTDATGSTRRLAAEYELRIPIAYRNRDRAMEDIEEHVDRGLLEAHMAAGRLALEIWQSNDAVDGSCTPLVGLLTEDRTRSTTLTPIANLDGHTSTDKPADAQNGQSTHAVGRPRTPRGYAVARKLVRRNSRWADIPIPVLAAAVGPLAERGWSAYQVDRACHVSETLPRRLLRALAATVAEIADSSRPDPRVQVMADRLVDLFRTQRRDAVPDGRVAARSVAAARHSAPAGSQARPTGLVPSRQRTAPPSTSDALVVAAATKRSDSVAIHALALQRARRERRTK
jgi:hypothetical protein